MSFIRQHVVSVKKSMLNEKQWCLLLKCGHEVWVTRKSRPSVKTIRCWECGRPYSQKPNFPTWENATCQYCGHAEKTGDALFLFECPKCGREGCPECMTAGRGCICPECEEKQ
jgi:predicted RNA-binding Zn-ribbon protein involved in translation (DUF1610 family)